MSTPTHSPRRLAEPNGWVAYLSRSSARRLIVFVHGFRGKTVKTWRCFAESGGVSEWWQESDLLFVSYDSVREVIAGVADRLREELPRFYPRPPPGLCEIGGVRARDEDGTYEELYLVGHSQGGVVVRLALADAAEEWRRARAQDPGVPAPAVLTARSRLFSPASEGFRPAGPLGMLEASPGWVLVEMYLRRSSAFADLQPDSDLLKTTREQTEKLVRLDETAFDALRAWIVWANPEDVVRVKRYETDHVQVTAHGKDHSQVCKPNWAYRLPWVFVETGRTR